MGQIKNIKLHIVTDIKKIKHEMSRLFIGGLGDNVDRRDLEREFGTWGHVEDCFVARNPPGFAFVVYEKSRDAEKAIKEMDGAMVCGSKVRVEHARPRGAGGRGGRNMSDIKCYNCGKMGHMSKDCSGRAATYGYSSRARSPSRSRSRSRDRTSRRRYEDQRERSRSREDNRSRRTDTRSPTNNRSRRTLTRSPVGERNKRARTSATPDVASRRTTPRPDNRRTKSPINRQTRSPDNRRSRSPHDRRAPPSPISEQPEVCEPEKPVNWADATCEE